MEYGTRGAAAVTVRGVEPWCVAIVFVAVVALLSTFYIRTSAVKNLDSVFLYESMQSVADGKGPVSRTVATWPQAVWSFTVPAAEVCAAPLTATGPEQYNLLDNHAYMALFPLGFLSAGLKPEVTLGIANALAHALLLLLPYLFLRRHGTRAAPAAVFSTCLALYVGWSYSAGGEYYLDRLYMPLALGACYLGHRVFAEGKDQPRMVASFLLCALGAAMCSERAAMMMSGLLVFLAVFQPRPIRASTRTTVLVATAAVVLAIYVLAYFKWVHVGIESAGKNAFLHAWGTLRAPLQRLQNPDVLPFMLVNAPLVAIASFSGWRYMLLLVGSMLPNVLVSSGGAELNGWATHYHAMYIPFLVFGASVGYARAASSLVPARQLAFALVALLTLSAWVTTLDPATGSFGPPSTATIKQSIIGRVHAYFLRPSESHDRALSEALSGLAETVPEGVRVAAMERAMPALYRGRHVFYYPLGLNEVDYVVIPGTVDEGNISGLSGAVSYLGSEEADALNNCLAERLLRSGFVLAHYLPAVSLVVLRREQGALQAW